MRGRGGIRREDLQRGSMRSGTSSAGEPERLDQVAHAGAFSWVGGREPVSFMRPATRFVGESTILQVVWPQRLGHWIGPAHVWPRLSDNLSAYLQILRETGATGLEPATSGVTGRIRWYSAEPEPSAQYRYCRGLSLRTSTLFLEFHGAASLFPPHLYPIAASPISQTPSAFTRRFNDYGRQTSDSETDSLPSWCGVRDL